MVVWPEPQPIELGQAETVVVRSALQSARFTRLLIGNPLTLQSD